jgi:hypothetical protein
MNIAAHLDAISLLAAVVYGAVALAVATKRRLDKDHDGAPDPGTAAGSAYITPSVQPLIILAVMGAVVVAIIVAAGLDFAAAVELARAVAAGGFPSSVAHTAVASRE